MDSTDPQIQPAVMIRFGFKRYSPNAIILKGLNMTVPHSAIYGLLGPSGCGKTTLLNCLIGCQSLDSGSIALSVKKKSDVGYMPQEISLEGELTIGEVFMYYGRIHGMNKTAVEVRQKHLVDLLRLPSLAKRICRTSGGEQRRISMAVTLLHDPELLILDEPTVGVDPLLRNEIWDYFVKMVSEGGKTIIITTHYIEEAQSSNVVGLMRGGVLLAEEAPSRLLERHALDTLEQVFLILSKRQQQLEVDQEAEEYPPMGDSKCHPLQDRGAWLNGHRILAQLIKNCYFTYRNYSVTLFAICLPPLLYLIIGLIVASEKGPYMGRRHLAVVSGEAGWPRCLQAPHQPLEASPSEPPCPGSTLLASCLYLSALSRIYNIEMYSRYEDGIASVKRGNAFGVIAFPSNYSRQIVHRLRHQRKVNNSTLQQSTPALALDMSDFPNAMRAVQDVIDRLVETLQVVCSECGLNAKLAAIPVTVVEYIHGSKNGSVTISLVPAYICSVAFYSTLVITSSSIHEDMNSGSFSRTQTSGLKYVEMVVAQVIIQLAVMCIQNAVSFAVMYGYFDFPMRGSMAVTFLVISSTEILGMASGFLLAALFQDFVSISYAGVGIVLSLFLLCGSLWPVEGIHWVLKPISNLIPITGATRSYWHVSVKGWSLSNPAVYGGILTSMAATLLVGVATYVFVTKNRKFS